MSSKNSLHDNVLKLEDPLPGTDSILLEYCGGGELQDYLKKTGKLEPKIVSSFGNQIYDGLKHLHSINIIHRYLSIHIQHI